MENNITTQKITNLISILGKIKNLRRRGWLERKVMQPESDADHMFSVAFLVLMFTPNNLNKLKCLCLALTHDLPEIYSRDYLPGEISSEEKYQKELASVNRIADELEFPELTDWFMEFEAQETAEAKFVKSLDKLDNVITAAYYENNNLAPYQLVPEFGNFAKQQIADINSKDSVFCLQIINHILDSAE